MDLKYLKIIVKVSRISGSEIVSVLFLRESIVVVCGNFPVRCQVLWFGNLVVLLLELNFREFSVLGLPLVRSNLLIALPHKFES